MLVLIKAGGKDEAIVEKDQTNDIGNFLISQQPHPLTCPSSQFDQATIQAGIPSVSLATSGRSRFDR